MDDVQVLATGRPQELLQRTQSQTLETAFLRLLPPAKTKHHREVRIPPLPHSDEVVIESHGLSKKFGDFTAVDDVNLQVFKGEIFGFLGSNGCGKSTTMKMLTGLIPPSAGTATLLDQPIDASNLATRRRVGYMSQSFSLYGELSVEQNLYLHARLFHLPRALQKERVDTLAQRFELQEVRHQLPNDLPLGVRQRLQLAVAVLHEPEVLILDEPTSGVDPVARDKFWELLADLSRRDGVTIFLSTHFMNEAEHCDRMSMMHAGVVLDTGTPAELVAKRGADNLEDAFIGYLEEAIGRQPEPEPERALEVPEGQDRRVGNAGLGMQRLLSYSHRESLELRRDPVRLLMALVGSMLLMMVMGYIINMDVDNLNYAVYDLDQSVASQNYNLQIAGTSYFNERPAVSSYADLSQRMRDRKS